MTLFQRKPTQDDLIAFHLHELSPRRERYVRRRLQSDAELAFESEAIAATLGLFSPEEAYPRPDAAALDGHWLAIGAGLPVHLPRAVSGRLDSSGGWYRPVLAGAGACGVAATAAFFLMHAGRQGARSEAAKVSAEAVTRRVESSPTEGGEMSGYVKDGTGVAGRFGERDPVRLRGFSRTGGNGQGTDVLGTDVPETRTGVSDGGSFVASERNEVGPQMAAGAVASVGETLAESLGAALSDGSSSRVSAVQGADAAKASSATTSRTVRPSFLERKGSAKDVTVAALGNWIAGRSSSDSAGAGTSGGVGTAGTHTVRASSSAGGLVSFHQQFAKWAGYRVTGSFSQPSFTYGYKPNANSSETTSTEAAQMYEISGTYVVRGPHYRRLSTTAEAGVGVLVLLAERTADKTYRIAPVVGVGAEVAMSQHVSLHAQYRALILRMPEFQDTYSTASAPVSVSSQPSVGITYRFGERHND